MAFDQRPYTTGSVYGWSLTETQDGGQPWDPVGVTAVTLYLYPPGGVAVALPASQVAGVWQASAGPGDLYAPGLWLRTWEVDDAAGPHRALPIPFIVAEAVPAAALAPPPAPGFDHALLSHLDYASAGHAGFAPSSRRVLPGTGLSGGGDLSADRTLSLADTAVTPGSYVNAGITVDQQGRVTAASSGAGGGVTSFNTRAGAVVLTAADVGAALPAVGTPGTVGDATHYPVITTDAQGRVVAATAQPLPGGSGGFPGVFTATDPTTSSNHNDQWYYQTNVTFTGVTANPNFSNLGVSEANVTVNSGRNSGNSANNSTSKLTYYVGYNQLTAYGCGQRFLFNDHLTAYGCGDVFVSGDNVLCYGGVTAGGDEGQCYRTMHLDQAQAPVLTTVASVPAPATLNTTVATAVTANISAQAAALASVVGVSVGQWLVFDPHNPADANAADMEAVKVTAVDGAANTVTAVFTRNHPAGAPVVPAVPVGLSSASAVGQQRWLVNLSRPSYSAGTAAGTRGVTGLVGVGTAWAAGMAGGDATNPGVVSLAADDEINPPFNATAGRLRDWYPIASVADATHLNIAHRSAVGVVGYTGTGTTQGAYAVRPGAPILMFEGNTPSSGVVVLGPNTFTWAAGDSVECAVSPDADVTGELMRLGWYSKGGTYRSVYSAVNEGLRQFASAFQANFQPLYGTAGADVPFDTALTASCSVNTGVFLTRCEKAAIQILAPAGSSPHICYDGNSQGRGIFYNPATFKMWIAGAGNFGTAGFAATSPPLGVLQFGAGVASYPDLLYPGTVTLSPGSGTNTTKLVFQGGGGPPPTWEARCNYPGTTFSVWSSQLGADALALDTGGNALLGQASRPAGATAGFPYVPSVAGTPTGVPAAKAGFVPLVYDTTGHKLWVYDGGAWRAMAAV